MTSVSVISGNYRIMSVIFGYRRWRDSRIKAPCPNQFLQFDSPRISRLLARPRSKWRVFSRCSCCARQCVRCVSRNQRKCSKIQNLWALYNMKKRYQLLVSYLFSKWDICLNAAESFLHELLSLVQYIVNITRKVIVTTSKHSSDIVVEIIKLLETSKGESCRRFDDLVRLCDFILL